MKDRAVREQLSVIVPAPPPTHRRRQSEQRIAWLLVAAGVGGMAILAWLLLGARP